MFGNIVLLCVPVIILAAAALCSSKEKEAIFCAAFAVMLFLFAGAGSIFGSGPAGNEGARLGLLFITAENIPFEMIKDINCPPGMLFLIKMCTLTGADVNVFVMILSGICAVSASLFIYLKCRSPYEGAYIFAVGFMVTAYISLSLFAALTVCAYASAYVQEHRFFRAAAFIAAAACFDASVMAVIPYYLIAFIPNVYISSAVSAASAAAFLFIPGVTDVLYSLFGEGTYTVRNPQILCVSFAIAGALTALLMTRMIKKRSEKLTCHIPLLCGGAALMLAAIWEGRLFTPAIALLMPSAVILAPDIHIIAVRFTQIVFPKDKRLSGHIATAVLAAVSFIPYVYMILTGCCGTSAFCTSVFGEGMLA